MEQSYINEVKDTYYEYINNLMSGILAISQNLRVDNLEKAFEMLGDLAEGLQWLLQVEKLMQQNNYFIASRVQEMSEMLNEVNEVLEMKDFMMVADLLEYEIAPKFESASEWTFEMGKKNNV